MALLHIHEVQDDEWFCLWISYRYKYTYIPKSTVPYVSRQYEFG